MNDVNPPLNSFGTSMAVRINSFRYFIPFFSSTMLIFMYIISLSMYSAIKLIRRHINVGFPGGVVLLTSTVTKFALLSNLMRSNTKMQHWWGFQISLIPFDLRLTYTAIQENSHEYKLEHSESSTSLNGKGRRLLGFAESTNQIEQFYLNHKFWVRNYFWNAWLVLDKPLQWRQSPFINIRSGHHSFRQNCTKVGNMHQVGQLPGFLIYSSSEAQCNQKVFVHQKRDELICHGEIHKLVDALQLNWIGFSFIKSQVTLLWLSAVQTCSLLLLSNRKTMSCLWMSRWCPWKAYQCQCSPEQTLSGTSFRSFR